MRSFEVGQCLPVWRECDVLGRTGQQLATDGDILESLGRGSGRGEKGLIRYSGLTWVDEYMALVEEACEQKKQQALLV